MKVQLLTVEKDEAELRLDRWFKQHFPGLGHGRLEKLLRTGQVRVDGKRAKAGVRLQPGQQVRVPPTASAAAPQTVQQNSRPAARTNEQDVAWLRDAVLHRDDWVIALNKPAGLAVQGGSRQPRHLDAMLDALRFEADERPRLVHRLDKDTSGVLLLARSRRAAQALAAAFRDGAVRKTYWAAVAAVPRLARGRIDMPIGKQLGVAREKMAGDPRGGAEAITDYAVAGTWKKQAAWLALRPLTGRTHQLRVHCAQIGHPILGDGKYGGKAAFLRGQPEIKRLQLHAREIALPHPADGTTLRVVAPLPGHMERSWEELGFAMAKGQRISDSLDD